MFVNNGPCISKKYFCINIVSTSMIVFTFIICVLYILNINTKNIVFIDTKPLSPITISLFYYLPLSHTILSSLPVALYTSLSLSPFYLYFSPLLSPFIFLFLSRILPYHTLLYQMTQQPDMSELWPPSVFNNVPPSYSVVCPCFYLSYTFSKTAWSDKVNR